MDLNKVWKTVEEKQFSNHKTNKEMIAQAIHQNSISTIGNLKKNLKRKLLWVAFFLIGFFVFAVFHIDKTLIIISMALLSLSYFLGGWAMWKQYRQMGTEEHYEKAALEVMKDNLCAIKGALRAETIFGLVTLPSAVVLAVIIGTTLSGGSQDEIIATLTNPHQLVFYGVLIIGAGLTSFFMNEYAYGSDIKQLQDQISRLEELNQE